jgi:outer membrane lipoprotein SlyB
MIKTYAAVAMAGLLLSGCAQDAGPKETSGALIGGLAGGLLGNTVGHGQGRAAATGLGAHICSSCRAISAPNTGWLMAEVPKWLLIPCALEA